MGRVIGIPVEVKDNEHRVALTPSGVRELTQRDVAVLVERGAGQDSAIGDGDYVAAGATIVGSAEEVWARADLVCKVKEPLPEEFPLMREGQVLFTYLHLAAYPDVARALLDRRVTGIAYETVQAASGALPLLAPMSEVAGRMATQIGSHYLERRNGGRGVLLGGVPGVRPATVVVLGAGNVGWNAAVMASGLGADVILVDKDVDRLRWVDSFRDGRMHTVAANTGEIAQAVAEADLLIGAVLVAGGRAPTVVTREMVGSMKERAVIVDVAVDQGGCIETTRETSHTDPVYEELDVLHYAVGNIPGAVPNTSTYALTNVTLPYLVALATQGFDSACRNDSSLALGLNTVNGAVVHDVVADALGAEFRPLADALA